MVHCFHLAGFPKGLISCVTGKGSEIGDFLTMHPGVNCIRYSFSHLKIVVITSTYGDIHLKPIQAIWNFFLFLFFGQVACASLYNQLGMCNCVLKLTLKLKTRYDNRDIVFACPVSSTFSYLMIICLSFTGGDTGVAISKKAGMIPLQMELGGKDACIILEDADLDLAAANIVKGGFSYR